jgi:hypothetical protein
MMLVSLWRVCLFFLDNGSVLGSRSGGRGCGPLAAAFGLRRSCRCGMLFTCFTIAEQRAEKVHFTRRRFKVYDSLASHNFGFTIG